MSWPSTCWIKKNNGPSKVNSPKISSRIMIMRAGSIGRLLKGIFNALFERFGPQGWWPGESELEIMIGAILAQNTNWRNVERAIENLKRKGPLSVEGLEREGENLEDRIRPAGYFRLKAKRLLSFLRWLKEQGGIESLRDRPTDLLRQQLLNLPGIGPETADSILLYALNRPVFVVDAYTRRILSRHRLISNQASYREIKGLFESHLPCDSALFNEYHALLVRLGKTLCRNRPLCHECPLLSLLGPPQNL